MAKTAAAVGEMDKRWQAESDLRCLIDAEKIKRDKGRLAAAMKKKKEMAADLAAIDGGKSKAASGL